MSELQDLMILFDHSIILPMLSPQSARHPRHDYNQVHSNIMNAALIKSLCNVIR